MASSLRASNTANPDPSPEHTSALEIKPSVQETPPVSGRSSSHTLANTPRQDFEKQPPSQSSTSAIPPENLNKFPGFGQWLKSSWLDIITLGILKGVIVVLYRLPPVVQCTFPVTLLNGQVADPDFAYPYRDEIISPLVSAWVNVCVPLLTIALLQIRIWSFWDLNNGVHGVLYALGTATTFQVFIKSFIGGLRPYFLAVCDPDPAALGTGQGFQHLVFDRSVCRGDPGRIDTAITSFPSGHTTANFAAFGFLFLYLNAKLKPWADHRPPHWALVAVVAPPLVALLLTGLHTVDHSHHWYDLLVGAVIGAAFAVAAFRMFYAAVWDFRFNHVPLLRNVPYRYGVGPGEQRGFETAVWTRRVGWGQRDVAKGGAPGDAAGKEAEDGGMELRSWHATPGASSLKGAEGVERSGSAANSIMSRRGSARNKDGSNEGPARSPIQDELV